MSIINRKKQVCPNCGERIIESYKYCPQCGQGRHNFNVPLRHFFQEAVEVIFHFDSKSVRTIKALIFRPGFLTAEFISGKRSGYVSPVRFYIFISFLFFLLLSLFTGKHNETVSAGRPQSNFYISFYEIDSRDLAGLEQSQLDSVMQAHGLSPSPLNRYVLRQMQRISTDGLEIFQHTLVKGISYMMFAMMPLFAFFIFILNRNKARYYIGTLIFSIHFHSFVFLLLTASLAVNRFANILFVGSITILTASVYLYSALKRVYGGSKMLLICKTLLVIVMEFISMVTLFLLTTFISLLIF